MNSEHTVKKVFNFTKIEHTAFSLPMIFVGAWIGGNGRFPALSIMIWIVVAAVGARIFGMAFNRIFDRKIDAQNPRTAKREMPTGKITMGSALAIAFSGLGVYLLACLALGGWCIILSPLPLIPLLSYSLLKRFTWLCHFGIGTCLGIAPLGAFVAASGHPYFTLQVCLFALFVFFWLSGADIIYSLMDMDNDKKNNIYSIPARFGGIRAQVIAACCHITAVSLLLAILLMSNAGIMSWFVLYLGIIVFVLMYIPSIPIPVRFFPLSTMAGIAGAVAPMIV